MRDQEIVDLWEAYHKVYAEQETQELAEEVEIAAQYFYEMGLNEDGVDILIEELGVEEFANFVYDIAEEYVLTEARAGGSKIEPKLSSGKAIQGKPKAASLKALRKKKAERQEAENKASESKPSGLKASLKRQSAVASAAKKQPKKPGLLDRVAGAVNRGIERHNKAMSAARETGKVIGKAAKGVGQVAKGVASGVSGTARLAGHVARKGLSDEYVMGYLIDEGYADTNEAALAIMANMSEEWRSSIDEETRRTEYLQKKFDKENAAKSGSAHTAIPGKQNTGQALYKARQSERQMRGESKEEPQKPFTGEGPKKPKGWKPTGPKLKTGQRPGYAR